ncbi:MAG: NUDIX hydrolase [SAR202 cluster bacterium]|nr:NUDIX hydrolase [SAR202 cluster bacterium]
MLQDDRYCPKCASPLEVRAAHGTPRPVCPACGKVIFYDPKLAAAVVVERDGRVLMVKRNTEPGLGLWSFPGGYVNRGESVEEGAAREVREETGLTVEIRGLVGLFSERGHPVVLAAFDGRAVGGSVIAATHEVQDVGFFPLDALPPLAFPRDAQVLKAWRRLRNGRN